jgi:hypothetical protein
MKIELMSLDEIQSAERNPKKHDLPSIIASIEAHGFNDPPALNEGTGRLVEGHGRVEGLRAMRDAGKAPPKHVELGKAKRGQPKPWMVPVLRGLTFETDAQAEAYLLEHNRLVETGGWDLEALAEIFPSLREAGVDVYGWAEQEQREIEAMAVAAGEVPELERKRNPGEKEDGFVSAEIKQVVLFFGSEEYAKTLERVAELMAAHGFKNHTEVFSAALAAFK